MRVILASKSPRRRELLRELFEDFEIIVAPTDETLDDGVLPKEGVQILAERKGYATYAELKSLGEDLSDTMIISSDTLVEIDEIPLGKPIDEMDAKRMLRMLSGRAHNVHTGVCVRLGEKVFSGVDTTRVYFKELSDGQIEAYVKSGEPMDKAGSYGIQGEAGRFVSHIEGDFDTVVGLCVRLTRALVERCYDKK
jgi:septum formation protein